MRVAEYDEPTLDTSEEEALDAEGDAASPSLSDRFAKRISEIVESFGLADELALHLEATCCAGWLDMFTSIANNS